MKKTSKKFSLDLSDYWKGFIVTIITAISATVMQMVEVWLTSPTFEIDKVNLILTVKMAIIAGVGYLIKNFVTPQQEVKKVE